MNILVPPAFGAGSALATADIEFNHAWNAFGKELPKVDSNVKNCLADPSGGSQHLASQAQELKNTIDANRNDLILIRAEMGTSDPIVTKEQLLKVDIDTGAREAQASMLEAAAKRLEPHFAKASTYHSRFLAIARNLSDKLVTGAELRNESQSRCRWYRSETAEFTNPNGKHSIAKMIDVQARIVSEIKAQHDGLLADAQKLRATGK